MLRSVFATVSEKVVAEQFDNEIVIVNLDSGAYFSLRESAATAWLALTNQVPPNEVAERLAGAAGADIGVVRGDVERFVQTLLENGLIERTDHVAQGWNGLPKAAAAYAAPVIEKYTDMEDLLLLDPVHDVDETGWPKKKAAEGGVAGVS